MNKIVTGHQPAYLPWLGFFHKIALSDEMVVMDDVQYEKHSYINRNKIYNGKNSFWLTIPLSVKDHRSRTIKDMKVVDHKWKRKHLSSIELAYKKAPYFNEVFLMVEASFNTDSDYLIDYTNFQLYEFLKYLEIDTAVSFASDLNIRSKKLDYVIELTQKMDGDMFVFGGQGKDYADTEVMAAAGVKPHFQEYNHPEYDQGSSEFMPYMSVIDGMFRVGKGLKDLIIANNVTRDQLRNE